ncbi:recombinase family protein [uncultured Duncaniella sp.]|uniref:recombinase family protein n=1 Tax=uncultured Duncaniella sp. TaxID=2768039 RepID=UPI00272D0349|nr:recombinase family protein [uncultured Duncaniella sp.]
MIRVVIFCRVSTKVQDYQRQINDLTECAELRGWSVEKSFCETISGATKNTKRKELLAMLDYIAQNDIKKVLVTELSRLGRDTLQVLEVIDMLNEAGVSLYIQNYNIETLTPEGKINAMSQFLVTILAEVAKMERRTIRERMESGYDNFINSGGRVGRKPGYRKTDDLLLVEYAEELRLLKKGISLRNVSKLTGTSVNTLRKCKALLN